MLKNNLEIFKILSYKNPALSTKCLEKIVFPLSETQEEVISKLCDTLRYHKGVYEKRGLALSGPQVGIFKKMMVVGIGKKVAAKQMVIIINPEIVDKSKEVCDDWEGCLSIPKLLALVERSKEIVLEFTNLHGKIQKMELAGFDARIIQHEMDHLDGIHMLLRAKQLKDNELFLEYKQMLKEQNILYKSDDEL